ncbi:MAG: triphosphoribosyl-dephospho-CoA synthase [Petroclostridium sp.]|jgi:triphosphoribosyl-dephospho-CoA synthase|uniref:triphosphoribosyl-dephospho-CoA synthase CitG n=1 Tax=Petroclostridium xylanilyticum TaxID=1792311 RepID=UPI000B999FCD|nr:triphosphoribosyl-dephospho-CoA synthase CitG [Petroclostridium xylanilyticum]MDK2809969.1 triphosphoribosyl-dephospho-CoA synthase [Petroclostridium sp.]
MTANFDICEQISQYAVESLLYEVSATPKPGLVDRRNAGAHKDMDYFTFMSSTAALAHYFYKSAVLGAEAAQKDPADLFNNLRALGIEAEKRMFEATGGVNTHKGLVFSLGIICAAAASCYFENNGSKLDCEIISSKIIKMTRGLSERELTASQNKEKMTYGEKIYKKYGIKGIRGEAESGYSTVLSTSLPVMRELVNSRAADINDILVQVLLYLMTVSEDTNVIARHDLCILEYVKEYARRALSLGGIFTEEGRKIIYEMDEDFIKKNISPGGSADLLAVTVMFYLLESMK